MNFPVVYAETAMIGISNLTFSTRAAIGTVVGTLSLYNASLTAMGANFMLTKGSSGYFAISGYNLVTSNVIAPGNYSIRVNAVGTKTWWDDQANFVITVTA
jgi:hypothetical protein